MPNCPVDAIRFCRAWRRHDAEGCETSNMLKATGRGRKQSAEKRPKAPVKPFAGDVTDPYAYDEQRGSTQNAEAKRKAGRRRKVNKGMLSPVVGYRL